MSNDELTIEERRAASEAIEAAASAARHSLWETMIQRGLSAEVAQAALERNRDRITARMTDFGARATVTDLNGGQMPSGIGVEVLAGQLHERLRHGPDAEWLLEAALVQAGMPPQEAAQRSRGHAYRDSFGTLRVRTGHGNKVDDQRADDLGWRSAIGTLMREYQNDTGGPSEAVMQKKREMLGLVPVKEPSEAAAADLRKRDERFGHVRYST